jgi:hypothetical protein
LRILQKFADQIWAVIARIFGWRPGQRTKPIVEWISAITGALVGVWMLGHLIFGGGTPTRHDIKSLTEQMPSRQEIKTLATREDIEKLKEELSKKLERLPQRGRTPAAKEDAVAGLAKDLDKAVETLLAEGRADALKDIRPARPRKLRSTS